MAWWRQLFQLKLREIPDYLKSTVTVNNVETKFNSWVADYKAKYIDTGSAKPLLDVAVGGFIIGYVVGWPQNYRHLKAQQAGGSH